ncbi:cysteine-rich repeat secretory protein 38-like [Corylus avellana]|uniref:cysteine-rich repeat secretory protein 38-like n=1 Tax=Corylus avellana TaxID=13451 RepID=UPI001E208D23|nr:cysteine-rich repeat secretory protein 38-like [Corylus avellana]
MSSSKFTSLLYLLSFVLLFKAAFGYGYLHHICSSTEKFTTNDPFDTNLRDLAGNLSNATPANGFALDSRGQSPYQVYGLALCLVNVPKEDCWGCVSNAGQDILNRCPNTKGATIWYVKCLFKYRNENFFGQLDLNGVGSCSPNNVSESIISFNENRNNLWSQLANETLGSQNLYAVGSSELNGSSKLYGFTQCTKDISRADCGVCLDSSFRYISENCNGKQGGSISTGSCSIRYEMYEFLNN